MTDFVDVADGAAYLLTLTRFISSTIQPKFEAQEGEIHKRVGEIANLTSNLLAFAEQPVVALAIVKKISLDLHALANKIPESPQWKDYETNYISKALEKRFMFAVRFSRNNHSDSPRDYIRRHFPDVHPVTMRFLAVTKSVQLTEELEKFIESQLAQTDIGSGFSKTFTPAPEHEQSLLGLLHYFTTVLKQKDREGRYSVNILHEGDTITLVVRYPPESAKKFHEVITGYGMVLSGQLSPEAFLPDRIDAHRLRQELQVAQLRVEQTRDTLALTRDHLGGRVKSLEEEVKFLRDTVAQQLSASTTLQQALSQALLQNTLPAMNEAQSSLVKTIAAAIDDRDSAKLQTAVKALEADSPSLLDRLHGFVMSSVTSGVLGNSVYDWLKMVWPVLPK